MPIYKLEQWREKADTALDAALKERESDPASGELAAAMQRIGENQAEILQEQWNTAIRIILPLISGKE